MSQTHDEHTPDGRDEHTAPEDLPVEETPAVAGGGDTTEPEQGAGQANSY